MKRVFQIILALSPLLVVALLGHLVLDDAHLEEDTDIHARIVICEESAANFHTLSRLLARSGSSFEQNFLEVWALKGAEREAFLLENQVVIRADYAALAPHRLLIKQIVEAGRIGDPPLDHNSPTIVYQNLRQMVRVVCLHADLSVVDPETEDDLGDLLALYEAMLDWAHHTHSTLHLMINLLAIDLMQSSLAEILNDPAHEGIAPRMRALLSKPHDFVEAASRVAWAEYCLTARFLDEFISGQNYFNRLGLNRNRTLNLYAASIREQDTLMAKGRWEELAALHDRLEREGLETSRIKNFVGRSFLAMVIPSMSKVLERTHKIEAQRTALLATE